MRHPRFSSFENTHSTDTVARDCRRIAELVSAPKRPSNFAAWFNRFRSGQTRRRKLSPDDPCRGSSDTKVSCESREENRRRINKSPSIDGGENASRSSNSTFARSTSSYYYIIPRVKGKKEMCASEERGVGLACARARTRREKRNTPTLARKAVFNIIAAYAMKTFCLERNARSVTVQGLTSSFVRFISLRGLDFPF